MTGRRKGGKKVAFGNVWVVAAIVVRLPFCSSPVALPVLLRLWRGKGTASQVELAAQMLGKLAGAFPGREVHGTGDAAFHGEPLVVEGTTWTTRLPANAVLYRPKPPPTGKRGRPRVKGDRLGTCAQIAASAAWADAVIHVYGQDTAVQVAVAGALWYGSFKTAPGRVVLVRDPGSGKAYDLGLFTLDTDADPAAIAERYSWRWAIEPSNATGKQILGVGDACNRVEKAVERTVPFGFLIQSLLICGYARCAHDPADIARRRRLCPWYRTKTEPSPADMLARLRRDFLKTRFSAIRPGQDGNEQVGPGAMDLRQHRRLTRKHEVPALSGHRHRDRTAQAACLLDRAARAAHDHRRRPRSVGGSSLPAMRRSSETTKTLRNRQAPRGASPGRW